MRTYAYDDDLTKYGSYLEEGLVPSKKFVKAIEKDVAKDMNSISTATCPYQALNKRVVYNELFDVFKQDLSVDFIKKIYTKDISKINLSDNRVICNTWAKLYTFFLNKHGIEAVISKNGVHYTVFFKTMGSIFHADGTTSLLDDDKSKMTDLTRARLGLKPLGLCRVINSAEKGVIFQNVFDSDLPLDERCFSSFPPLDKRVCDLLSQLRENQTFIRGEVGEEYKTVMDKFTTIHNLLLMDNLDPIGGVTYLNSLIRMFFTDEERSRLTNHYLKGHNGKEYQYIEHFNYSLNKEEARHFSYPIDGLNIVYKGEGLEVYPKRKARKMFEENDQIDMEVLEGKHR